jgi:predicted nucleic acid-binding protein
VISAQTVVLDTSVLAELMKPRPDLAVLRWTNAQPIGTLAVTAVSLAELTYAMLRMSDLARTIDLRQALNEFVHDDLANRVLPFDDLAADYFAEFAWRREQAGAPIDVAEAQVAATCRAYGVTLATKDPAPFAELGVTTVDPWTAPAPVRVEVPVVVSSPELDRNGKPIPPRRPGAARGGVGPSRPPRQRRPRRTTAKGAAAPRGAAAATDPAATPVDAESLVQSRRAATERMRRHVTAKAVPEKPATDGVGRNGDGPAKSPAAPPREEPVPRGPGRRGARLLGPLVDAEGRPVERTAEGRVRPRSGDRDRPDPPVK